MAVAKKPTRTKPKATPPWEKPAPKSAKAGQKLTPAKRAAAEARAKAAGRRYPNLVDNLWALRHAGTESAADEFPPDPEPEAAAKTTAKKTAARKASAKKP